MKCEVTYEVIEVTRYVIYKTGFDFSDNYGEFKSKHDAEAVRDALEADLGRKIRAAI